MNLVRIFSCIILSALAAIFACEVSAQTSNVEYSRPAPDGSRMPGARQELEVNSQLEVRISQLEEQIRTLQGKLEEAQYANTKLEDEMKKLTEDVNFRLSTIEKNTSSTEKNTDVKNQKTDDKILEKPQKTSEIKGNGTKILGTVKIEKGASADLNDGEEAPIKQSVKSQYESAYLLLKQSKYKDAEKAFKKFIQNNPKDPLLGNAYYWLGETLFVRKQYQDAAVEFLRGYKQAPKGPNAPDNLLKLSLSLSGSDKDTEACTVLAKLHKEFSDSSASVKQRAEIESSKLKCDIQ